MSEVLGQDEIDALLSIINAGLDNRQEDFRSEYEESRKRKIKIYDFKRPDKFSKEQIRTVSLLHETFARLTTACLSALTCSICHVHVASVDQLSYEEFIRSIPTPTTLGVINMDPLRGNAVLEIDPAITFSIIDLLCGGTGEGTKSQHELTDIEQSIMEGIIVRLLGNLREAWTHIIDLRPRLGQIDTNPQFMQIVSPNEMVVLITLETKINDVEGMMNLCIPYSTIESIIQNLSSASWYGKKIEIQKDYVLEDKENIPVKLTAELLRRNYPVKEILEWGIESEIKPLRQLQKDSGWLRIGDKRVFVFENLPDEKTFPKKIKILGITKENPYQTEGEYYMKENVNSLIADALANAGITVSVELGSVSKKVKEIIGMGEGTIVELDKLAGEPVDIKANGVLIAKGEVIVIDENFGVRITELVSNVDSALKKEEDGENKSLLTHKAIDVVDHYID